MIITDFFLHFFRDGIGEMHFHYVDFMKILRYNFGDIIG